MAEPVVYELSSSCRCTATDDDGNELKDDNGYPVAVDDCYGCWQDDFSNTEYDIIHPWQIANDLAEQDYVHISVDRATWRGVSGYGISKADLQSILDIMTFSGEWTLKLTYDGDKTLTAQRWSHDEPTGTGIFTFRRATDAEVEDWQRL